MTPCAVGLLCVLGCGACVDALAPDVGPENLAPTCSIVDSDPAVAVHFVADVLDPIIKQRCARCHDPAGDNPIGVSRSGLDLSSYATLRLGGSRSGPDVVVPGDACASILLQKLGASPPFGARMPLDRAPLPGSELQAISDWITEGALDD